MLVVAVVIAVSASGGDDAAKATEHETGAVTVEGDALPQYTGGRCRPGDRRPDPDALRRLVRRFAGHDRPHRQAASRDLRRALVSALPGRSAAHRRAREGWSVRGHRRRHGGDGDEPVGPELSAVGLVAARELAVPGPGRQPRADRSARVRADLVPLLRVRRRGGQGRRRAGWARSTRPTCRRSSPPSPPANRFPPPLAPALVFRASSYPQRLQTPTRSTRWRWVRKPVVRVTAAAAAATERSSPADAGTSSTRPHDAQMRWW